jgi:hypothetical protein
MDSTASVTLYVSSSAASFRARSFLARAVREVEPRNVDVMVWDVNARADERVVDDVTELPVLVVRDTIGVRRWVGDLSDASVAQEVRNALRGFRLVGR